jgi:hypothetical protein
LDAFQEHFAIWETAILAKPEVNIVRLAKNHGQLAAWVTLLGDVGLGLLPQDIVDVALTECAEMAVRKQRSLGKDHPIVQEFWECYEYIEHLSTKDELRLNHASPNEDCIAIHLKDFQAKAETFKLRPPDSAALKRHLKGSRSRLFVESNRAIYSYLYQKTMRCWVFKKQKGEID